MVLALLTLGLVVLKPSWGWQVRDFFSSGRRGGEVTDLALENQTLKAQLIKLQFQSSSLGDQAEYIPAFVYSRYPFSLKDEVFLDGGAEDGVRVDQAVLAAAGDSSTHLGVEGVLVGKIIRVFPERSVALTVFDDRWSSPVGIGSGRARALLKGGSRPKLTLIDKTTNLKEGDLVYNLDSNFPHALPLGTLANVHLAEDHLFFEADLEVAYNLGEVPVLWILK